jgi:hypothetical protein
MNKGKIIANRGIKRNKKPLKNMVYKVEISQLKPDTPIEEYTQYKFKDEGYLVLYWNYQNAGYWNWHGFIEPDKLKELLGVKQWQKFTQGKREFIIQRRIDGNNI